MSHGGAQRHGQVRMKGSLQLRMSLTNVAAAGVKGLGFHDVGVGLAGIGVL